MNRTVNVAITFNLIIEVPADWDEEAVNFHLNESSHCLDTELQAISLAALRHGCPCPFASGKYVGEATAEDEEAFGFEDHKAL